MARTNYRNTTTLDRKYDNNLLDMIDKKLQNSEPAVKTEMQRFDNSHRTDRLEEVYDELDLQEYMSSDSDSSFDRAIKVSKKDNPVIKTNHKPTPIQSENPFAVEKLMPTRQATYSDVVATSTVAPTIEIKSYTPIRPAKKSLKKRIKLWLVTGICCLVLLGGVVLVSALNLGATAGSNANTSNPPDVETGQLADEQGIINKSGEDLTVEDMTSLDQGTLSPDTATKVGGTTTSTSVTTSSSLWDQICAFFAHLFGR